MFHLSKFHPLKDTRDDDEECDRRFFSDNVRLWSESPRNCLHDYERYPSFENYDDNPRDEPGVTLEQEEVQLVPASFQPLPEEETIRTFWKSRRSRSSCLMIWKMTRFS